MSQSVEQACYQVLEKRRKRGLVEVMKSKLPYPQFLSVLGRNEGREGQDCDENFWQKTMNHIQPHLIILPTRFLTEQI